MQLHHPSIAAILLAFTFAADALAQGPPAGPPPAAVRVAPATHQNVREQRLVTGQVEAAKRSTVAAEEAGRVVVSPPPPGTILKAGQVITRLDDALLKIDLESAKAMVDEAQALVDETQAHLDVATRDLDRLRTLLSSNVARPKEVDDAEDSASVARARHALARAALGRQRAAVARLTERIDNTAILAPLDGTIVAKETELGEWLDPGDPVIQMIATDRLRIRLNVPELMVAAVSEDEPITLHVDALDRSYTADPHAIVPDASVQARTFSLLIYLDNPDGAAKAGMSVSSFLPTGKAVDAMTVPRDAVVTTTSGTVVWVDRGGAAAPVNVRVRFADGDRFVIDGQIRDGESVIIEGNERLAPGQPLNVLNPPAKPAAAAAP